MYMYLCIQVTVLAVPASLARDTIPLVAVWGQRRTAVFCWVMVAAATVMRPATPMRTVARMLVTLNANLLVSSFYNVFVCVGMEKYHCAHDWLDLVWNTIAVQVKAFQGYCKIV